MNCRHGRTMAWGIIVALAIACASTAGQAETVMGVVFVDLNGDGLMDDLETGLAGVSVSDGTSVTQTGDDGRFVISLNEASRFVFVSAPTGTTAGDCWYHPVAQGVANEVNFALTPEADEGPLVFVQISDIHYAPTPEEFREGLRDRRMSILPDPVLAEIVHDANAMDPDFVILTGDLVADSKYPEPERVDEWMTAVADFASQFHQPAYGVVGNHDVVRDESIGKGVYESSFGPTYYSFNMKGTHCVVLDMQQLVGTSLVYTVGPRQLAWLEQDLAAVNPNSPILVFCHEPSPTWAATDENAALLDLLTTQSITALINGHWHTNAVLQQEPFVELTSGAACGAWWEGAGPDGTGFGYRVFQMARGTLESVWQSAGHNNLDVPVPDEAIVTWANPLLAHAWGHATSASIHWDDELPIEAPVRWNGLWSSVSTTLNVSPFADGYHTLTVRFAFADAPPITETRTYYISNPSISLAEVFDHPETYRGKLVAAPNLEVRAVMGTDISGTDGKKTIIITKVPYDLTRGDPFGIVGMYRPTSTAPINVYDPIFFTLYDEDDSQ